jgi:hypothetical protein
MAEGVIALFELTISADAVKIVQEKHYSLVPEGTISEEELQDYKNRAQD